MDTATHILSDILEELRKVNEKLDNLEIKVDRITGFGECDMQDLSIKIDDVTLSGTHSLADVCGRIDDAAEAITKLVKKEE